MSINMNNLFIEILLLISDYKLRLKSNLFKSENNECGLVLHQVDMI